MAKSVSRRKFLSGVAASPALAQVARSTEAKTEAAYTYPRKFSGRNLKEISFPLGGIGAGSIGLGGRGQLRDWQIFNRPDKGGSPKYAFPAIFVQEAGGKPIARVLESRILPPYEGPSGLGSNNVPGLPRLAASIFTGEYPLARVEFRDADLPIRASLEAFTPFVPLDADASGLPVAVLRYRVANAGRRPMKVSIALSLDNPVGNEGRSCEYRSDDGLAGLLMRNPFLPASDPMAGSFALVVLDKGNGKLTYLRGWPQMRWPWTGALLFWDDFSADGELGPEAAVRDTSGSLCLSRDLTPKQEAEYTFLLAWHFPNRTPQRCGWTAPKGEERAAIGNHYATRFADAWKAAQYAASELPDLERRTREFASAMRETTLPAAVIDAAASNLSTLVTETSFRGSDGHFYGFEGCNDRLGCCFGTCTHVWNYEVATAFLFPTLSRSMRERSFTVRMHENGMMDFRELLPAGKEHWGRAAADGQMGQIMKLYLDWRLSGDEAWLKRLWPGAKQALEFAWIKGGWDANRDGVMEGAQHNTYDVEFYGPNPLCGVWYLGALRAVEELAKAAGDPEFAGECRRLFENGSRWIDRNLFNGEFYIQKIQALTKEQIADGLLVGMGATDPAKPDFQVGDGCLVDQLVGQYFADVAGLGDLLATDKIRKTAQSIYKYNYKPALYNHEAVQRVFALNDEAGLVICDYGKGERPKIPFPYFAELMTGFEYSAAALMLSRGLMKEGLEAIQSIRRRYDGERRNPWDEAECGHHYARAMASWAAIPILTGFRYHAGEKSLGVTPRLRRERFRSVWSSGTAWGTFALESQAQRTRLTLRVSGGELACQTVELRRPAGAAKSEARLGQAALPHELKSNGRQAVFTFAEDVRVSVGKVLELVITG